MSHKKTKSNLIPIWIIVIYRILRYKEFRDSHFRILLRRYPNKIGFINRISIIHTAHRIPYCVETASTPVEQLAFIDAIFSIPFEIKGKVAEVGVYKGGTSCVLSAACEIAKRELVLFDSYEGIPTNDEVNEYNLHGITGKETIFSKGDYCGSLEEVKANIRNYGKINTCSFVKGFVEETLPIVQDEFVCVYSDVDLGSATRTILKYFYPLLCEEGYIFSQDGHLSEVVKVFMDNKFFEDELGIKKPITHGLHENKLIFIRSA